MLQRPLGENRIEGMERVLERFEIRTQPLPRKVYDRLEVCDVISQLLEPI